LSEAYKEVMNHIAVTEEMKSRILKNIANANLKKEKVIPFFFAKRYMTIAACLVLLIVGTVSLTTFRTPVQPENPLGTGNTILSIKKASSADELSQLVGFEVEDLRYIPFAVTEIQYTSYQEKLAEIKYSGELQNLVFRKIAGETDPSGDFTSYSDTLTLSCNNMSISLKGESDMYTLAVWKDKTYSYSIQSSVPLSELEWIRIFETEG
jgi:hypothetical protein